MSYLSNAEFLIRFDSRLIGDLVQDGNVRKTANELESDTTLAAILNDASGWIDSAAFVGQRYSADDLNNLPTNSSSLLKRLVADIALVLLSQRRGYSYADKFPLLAESLKMVERLRLGERVFDVVGVEEKGNPTSDEVSLAKILLEHPVSTSFRYFPQRIPVFE